VLTRKLAASLALFCSASAWANSYGNLYFFGDSLSDAGAFTNLIVASGGSASTARFTTNPGNVWAQNLGALYGINVTTGYSLNPATGLFAASGGNDYAIGGARVTQTPGVFPASAAIAANIVPLSGQIGAHLGQTGGSAAANSLYAVWIGANDVFTQAGAVGAGALSPTAAGLNMVTAAADAVTQIGRLRTAGVRNLLVIALPDMGINPYAASSPAGTSQLLTGLSGTYNDALRQGLLSAGMTNLAYFDPRPLFADMLARPAAYGFTNTTVPACGAASSLGCGPAQQLPGSAGFLFADGVHPSAATHRIISDWIYGSLEAPSKAAALAALPIGRSGAQWRAIDNRLRNFEAGSGGQGVFVGGDHAPTRLDATATAPALSGRGNSLTLGYDKAFGNIAAGLAFGVSDTDFDYANGGGKVVFSEAALSGFVAARFGQAYVDAILSYARLDFDTTRNVALGPTSMSNNGTTQARQKGFKLGGGYNFTGGTMVHGPVAALSWEQVDVDGYSETGSVTAMSFGAQRRDSLRSRLGWQVLGDVQTAWARLRPYARLTHEREHKDNQRTMTAGFVGEPFSFSVPTNGAKDSYGLIAIGTTMQYKTVSADIGYTSTFSQSGARNQSLSVGISIPY